MPPLYHRCKEVAETNAYVVYISVCQRESKEALTSKESRERIIEGFLAEYAWSDRIGRRSPNPLPARLTERHSIAKYEGEKHKHDSGICSERNRIGWKHRQTSYYCKQCKQPLCCVPCMELCHSYSDLKAPVARVLQGQAANMLDRLT